MTARLTAGGAVGPAPILFDNPTERGPTGALYYETPEFTPVSGGNYTLTAKCQLTSTTDGPQTVSLYYDDTVPGNLIDQAQNFGLGQHRIALQGAITVTNDEPHIFIVTVATDAGDLTIPAHGFQVIAKEQ
jgi:hypothetical protein